MTLPDRLIIGPRWVLPLLEAALLVPLTIHRPRRHHDDPAWIRALSVGLIALVNAANVMTLVLLVYYLINGGRTEGRELVISSVQIWMTNVLIFGLWYWELDRGGPGARTRDTPTPPDFLFPQNVNPEAAGTVNWRPGFVDYLYVSCTNATAFSPTDTMPLTAMAKALMAIQALASLLTVAVVAARAVNILS